MSQERHHLFHHKEGKKATPDNTSSAYDKARKDEKHHKRMEHVAKLGAVAAGSIAMHEKHEAKKHPEHARRHKIKEEIAVAAAAGSAAFAVHEHHEKKDAKKRAKEASGKKHHHLF